MLADLDGQHYPNALKFYLPIAGLLASLDVIKFIHVYISPDLFLPHRPSNKYGTPSKQVHQGTIWEQYGFECGTHMG